MNMILEFFSAIYTEWKGNKCHPFNSRGDGWKDQKNIYKIWGLNLIVFSKKGVSCSVHIILLTIVRDNEKKFISVGLSYKDVMLFSKIFYVFDVVYVKSNSILC